MKRLIKIARKGLTEIIKAKDYILLQRKALRLKEEDFKSLTLMFQEEIILIY